ncbi:MAG: methyltransferase domain-containing protein [Candidatus Acidiferrum sp.]
MAGATGRAEETKGQGTCFSALNLGCGKRFHPDWVNIDLHPTSPCVRKWDLKENLPFLDGSFDVVYHSHVLEHFSRTDGLRLLGRCRRVLRAGGTLRVVVPDLERIVYLYLGSLEKSLAGDQEAALQHEWALLEMYDQTVREGSGGEMLAYLRQGNESQITFMRARLGGELEHMLAAQGTALTSKKDNRVRGLVETMRRKALRLLVGREGVAAYDHGRFRRSGEVHKWMYDRYSLAKALKCAGFIDAKQCGAPDSRIPQWPSFHLDTDPDGSTYKPDSLFMEATRP